MIERLMFIAAYQMDVYIHVLIKFDERISKVDLFIHFLDKFYTVYSIVP